MGIRMNRQTLSAHGACRNGRCTAGRLAACLSLLVLAAAVMASAGCIGMLKIANETGKKTPATAEERAALLQKIIEDTGEEETAPGRIAAAATLPAQPDALNLRQEYIYGDAGHEIHASVYNVTLLPFYFWWFIDYNKFVVEQPKPGNQFLVVYLRFENTGTKSTLVPSAELLPVVSGETIYPHRHYFNTSVTSSYQQETYNVANEVAKLPYQWIRELGQDQRDYAFLTGYYAIGTGDDDDDDDTDDDDDDDETGTNTSTYSYATRCEGSISVTTESGKIVTKDISDGQCPGFFIKPGPGNVIDGYLIYEVPETLDLKKTYLYGFFNRYSGTRWRLG